MSRLVWPLVLVLGGGLGHLLATRWMTPPEAPPAPAPAPQPNQIQVVRGDPQGSVRPLLMCRPTDEDLNLLDLQEALQHTIDGLRLGGQLESASLYLDRLDGSGSLEVYGDVLYCPASLNKILWLIVALEFEQGHPGWMARPVAEHEQAAPEMPVPVGPARNLAAPRALRDVVEAMIVDSHNDGMFRIRDAIPPEFYLHIYEAFGLRRLLNTPMRPGDENVIRAREIGQVLRRLYEGTYLPPARSEQALAMLSRARFPWGIRAAVPGVPMAHKFGEYVYQVDGGWEVQFHHCAVVYEPNPYVLCVMTRGRDFDELVDAVEVLAEQAHAALLDLSPPG